MRLSSAVRLICGRRKISRAADAKIAGPADDLSGDDS
jgi:hypothetical protein